MKIPRMDDAKGPVTEAVGEKMVPLPRQFSGCSVVGFPGSTQHSFSFSVGAMQGPPWLLSVLLCNPAGRVILTPWGQSRSCGNFVLGGEFAAVGWCWTPEALLRAVLTELCSGAWGWGPSHEGGRQVCASASTRRIETASTRERLLPSPRRAGGWERTHTAHPVVAQTPAGSQEGRSRRPSASAQAQAQGPSESRSRGHHFCARWFPRERPLHGW